MMKRPTNNKTRSRLFSFMLKLNQTGSQTEMEVSSTSQVSTKKLWTIGLIGLLIALSFLAQASQAGRMIADIIQRILKL